MQPDMQSELFVPEGWVLEGPHYQDREKEVYRDLLGVRYRPHHYWNGKSFSWGWLPIAPVLGSTPPTIESSCG